MNSRRQIKRRQFKRHFINALTGYLTPRQKYQYDTLNINKDNVLYHYYATIYPNKYKDQYPNITDFWNWLWTQQTFDAYRSYNVKESWLQDEVVKSYLTGASNFILPLPTPEQNNNNNNTDTTQDEKMKKYLMVGGALAAVYFLTQD